jgi:4-amino-4-deoxy-L-arabinose transferase-like glycosyltransferase
VDAGLWYAQYPPGYPALLTLGVWAGLPWLVNPLIGALNAVVVYALAREIATDGEARLAAVLAGFSPFVLLMGSDYMSHPTSLLCSTVFMLGVVRGMRGGGAAWFAAAGFAGAFAIAARPFSAIGICLPFALVAAFWLLRQRRWGGIVAAAAAAAVPLALFLLYNWGMTGDPFVLGYTKQHGVGHSPGFGQKMWGVHTPLMGLGHSLTNLNAFNKDFLQLPLPALAPVALLFAVGRPTRWDALLLVSFFFLSGLHTLYPRQTLYLGPKLLFEGVSVIAILATRGFAEGARQMEPWMRDERHRRRIVWIAAVALLVVFPLVLGARLWTVRNGYSDPAIVRTVAAANLRDAVVFVPQPKGRRFAAAFDANTPGPDGPVVYAADRGEENGRLLAVYPGRTAWVWREEGLVPLEEAYR